MIHSVAGNAKGGASAELEFEKKRLKKVCDEFGALLTQQLLHAMREGTLKAEEPGESQQVYESMFDQALSLDVSKHQNGGLSSMLYRQLLPLLDGKGQHNSTPKPE